MIKPGRVITASILTLDGDVIAEGLEPASKRDRATGAAIDATKARGEDVILIDDDGVWQIDHTGQRPAPRLTREYVWVLDSVAGFDDDELVEKLAAWHDCAPCYWDSDAREGETFEVVVTVRKARYGLTPGLYEGEPGDMRYLGGPGGRPVPDGLRALTDDAFAAVCMGDGGGGK